MSQKIFADLQFLASNNPYIRGIASEDQIDLKLNVISEGEGSGRIAAGGTNVSLNNNSIRSLLDSIPKNEIDTLFNEVTSTTLTKGYITALKVHFAYDKNSAHLGLRLVYQPVRLLYRFYDYGTNDHMYQISVSGKYYSLEGSEFKQCNDAETWIKDYCSNVQIKRDYNPTTPFEIYSDKSDPSYMLFPFQLIYKILNDNDNDVLEIYNVVTGIPDHVSLPLFHSLLLFSQLKNNRGSFANKFADRSHLCPPCKAIYFGFDL